MKGGVGRMAANTLDPDYMYGVASGGLNGMDGSDGMVVISSFVSGRVCEAAWLSLSRGVL